MVKVIIVTTTTTTTTTTIGIVAVNLCSMKYI